VDADCPVCYSYRRATVKHPVRRKGATPLKNTGEYAERGEYHKLLDPNWSYYPIYIRKLALVDGLISELAPDAKILDAGCGEGVLVEKYRSQNRDISGCDLNYESEFVDKMDILNMPYEDGRFDMVLFLDVIEHLSVMDQDTALAEMKRVLSQTGSLVISIPNLAHLASRSTFLFTGGLVRTADISKHPGDRPIAEYLDMINRAGLEITRRIPIKLTFPSLIDRIGNKFLGKTWNKILLWDKWNPNLCFLNLLVLRKRQGAL
jgi:2-polyprenyl-3-methyl-5-hydroxy-6-metoxy-1,4-benzoquinol methylase